MFLSFLNGKSRVDHSLIGSSGSNKSITGTTNDQGYATVTITDNSEEIVSMVVASTTLPVTQAHQNISIDFRHPIIQPVESSANPGTDEKPNDAKGK